MADEQTVEPGIPAISLPAGSFELSALQKALDGATGVKNRDLHPERITNAIVAAASDATKEVLGNADRPVLPVGAVLVDSEQVLREGEAPVKRKVVAFRGVDAESGEEASKMAYRQEGDKIVGVESGEPVPVSEAEPAVTLTSVAAEAIDSDAETPAKASTNKKS